MQTVQILGRIFFRAYVIAMLTLLWDNKAFYGLPMGLLFGYLSEFENLTKKKKEEDKEEKVEKKPNQPTFEDNWPEKYKKGVSCGIWKLGEELTLIAVGGN